MTNGDEEVLSLEELMAGDAGAGVPEIGDRDMASLILPDLDYESQLIAISDLLRQNQGADERNTARIAEVYALARRTTGTRDQRAVDEWVDLLQGSTYQSAAHSMAAVGMLAPLIESLFYQAFQGIRARFYEAEFMPAGHVRRGMLKTAEFWDCHFVFKATRQSKCQKDLVPGIMELADAVKLTGHLPRGLRETLEPLFRYRNKMFHFGFEWPPKECEAFRTEIAKNGWGGLFSSATRSDVPFIFYMTDDLINRAFDLVHELLDAFGTYCKAQRETGR